MKSEERKKVPTPKGRRRWRVFRQVLRMSWASPVCPMGAGSIPQFLGVLGRAYGFESNPPENFHLLRRKKWL